MTAATFETYGKTVSLNLEAKSINGFTATSFPTYLELFKAASLTNRFKKIFAGQKRAGDDKFNIS